MTLHRMHLGGNSYTLVDEIKQEYFVRFGDGCEFRMTSREGNLVGWRLDFSGDFRVTCPHGEERIWGPIRS